MRKNKTNWLLKFIFVFCLFSFSQKPSASDCRSEFSAPFVFKNFVKQELKENFSKHFSSDWEEKIVSYTKHWSAEEAKNFLDLVVTRIGKQAILQRLQTPSYFIVARPHKFKETLFILENYIGGEKGTNIVNAHLSRSFHGFFIMESINNFKKILLFIENYVGRENLIKKLEKSLSGLYNVEKKKN